MVDTAQGSGRRRAERVVVLGALVAALCAPVIIGLAASYLIALVALAAFVVLLLVREVDWRPDLMTWVMLGAFAALLVSAAATARTPGDVRFALNFAALPLYWPLSVLLRRAARPGNAVRLADFALAGVVAALAVCVIEVVFFGATRAGRFLTDPIRLANTAVILAFLALVGGLAIGSAARPVPAAAPNVPRRWLYLVGPLLALAVVFLTATRIAMVAFPILAVAAILMLTRRRLVGLGIAVAAIALLAAVALLNVFGSERLDMLFETVGDVMSGRAPLNDEAVRIRFALYDAGWLAFQQSPIFGHGWGRMMIAAGEHLLREDRALVRYPHLHNEALTFAVFAGTVGLAAYVALMAAPVVMALRSPRDGQRPVRIAGTTILVLAYALMGLTDTMLAFELHTALFVAWNALLLSYCRDAPPSRGAASGGRGRMGERSS